MGSLKESGVQTGLWSDDSVELELGLGSRSPPLPSYDSLGESNSSDRGLSEEDSLNTLCDATPQQHEGQIGLSPEQHLYRFTFNPGKYNRGSPFNKYNGRPQISQTKEEKDRRFVHSFNRFLPNKTTPYDKTSGSMFELTDALVEDAISYLTL